MKPVFLLMILAAAIGTSVAWAINYNRYGAHEAVFGPITLDGSVTAENAAAVVAEDDTEFLPKAVVVGDATHDFGTMAPNQEGEHTFVIKNEGEDMLTLELGATTCKCTLGELGDSELAPGEEAEIKLSWTVKTNDSTFQQSAEIRTNDPANLAVSLKVMGQVVREMAVEPEAWLIGEVASGESFEVEGKVYSYLENEIVPTAHQFTSDAMTDLAEFEVTEFDPGQSDTLHSKATQGFRVKAKVKPGMRQGALSVYYLFGFQKKDENGEIVPPAEGDDDPNDYVRVEVSGRIVGALSMIEGSRIRNVSGSYVYEFGRVGPEDSLKAKAFIVLKGSEKDNTNLTIGEVTPDEIVKAKLGERMNRGRMVLYPLEIELVPGEKDLDYTGKSSFGSIWIESDNPKVAKMRVAVKFLLEGRP